MLTVQTSSTMIKTRKLTLLKYCFKKSTGLIWILPPFSLITSLCSWIWSQIPRCIWLSSLLQSVTAPVFPHLLRPWHFWRVPASYLWTTAQFGLIWLAWGVEHFSRNAPGVVLCPSHTSWLGFPMLIRSHVKPDHLVKLVSARFVPQQSYCFFISEIIKYHTGRSFETVQMCISDACLQNILLWCWPVSVMPPTFLIGILRGRTDASSSFIDWFGNLSSYRLEYLFYSGRYNPLLSLFSCSDCCRFGY